MTNESRPENDSLSPEPGPSSGRNSAHKSKHLNTLLWVLIAVTAVLLGACAIWASHQPGVRSVWAPEE